ncbi:MAG TPA: class I SAM-dependent methyltransferase [Chitinophagaceae bacterium]|nr:class I SAM-dependent methyltransferase [Chitinophagaceae bacterium]
MTDLINRHPASFKDPAGFVFKQDNKIYRQVNQSYADNYQQFMQSGFYDKLVQKKWLLSHSEIRENITGMDSWHLTLLPEQLSFISYPYEWSFDMLKDAALLTLKINKAAIEHGLLLKDATPFNIQFHQGKPVFIDTLSFEKYNEAKPWIAYRQFCECFLFPLYLNHYTGIDSGKLLSVYPDGLPASMTARLLPFKSRFNLSVWMHVYLQRNIQQKDSGAKQRQVGFSKKKLLLLLNGLTESIKKLSINTDSTTWSNYYTETILGKGYLQEKEKIFKEYIDPISFNSALDLGANDGYFSRIAAGKAGRVIATDFDSKCINNLYKGIKTNKTTNILPLVVDISNPSPGIGFINKERDAFIDRAQCDLVLALALIHHLVFGKNIPLAMLPEFFAKLTGQHLVIEFVPLEDEKVQLLLQNKEEYHRGYSVNVFEKVFSARFNILQKQPIAGTNRVLYLMKRL